jgi:ankyrin repeat protein
MTPLTWAALLNPNPDVITALLKDGADVKARGENCVTALILAAGGTQNPEVVSALLKAGADAKVKDKSRKTALDYAQRNANLKGTGALRKLEEASK